MKKELVCLIILMNIGLVLGASIVEFTYDFNKTAESDEFIHYTDSVQLTIKTTSNTDCFYTSVEGTVPSNPFEKNYGIRHEKILENLEDKNHKYYIKCGINTSSPIMEVSFNTKRPISAQVSISESAPLKAGTYGVTLVTSTPTLGEPVLEYSFDSLVYNPLPLEGYGNTWTGHLIIEKNVGEKIGSFRFRGVDLNGKEGTKINNDRVFIVDTKVPEVVQTIEATGYKGEIKLSWNLEEEVEEYIIYRSENQGVEFTDEYKTTEKDSYLDTAVTNGQTYYYRVVAVDKAGNKGQFSREVYATALLYNNTNQVGGLNPSLVGKVDNLLVEIKLTKEDIETIQNSMNSKEEKVKKITEDLDLSTEFQNALVEINSLTRDVERFKEQDLSEIELDKKINSAKVRLDVIEKGVPETLTIISENEIKRDISENDFTEVILEYSKESLSEEEAKNTISLTKRLLNEEEIKITSNLYNIEITYLDGTTNELTLIRDIIEAQLERSDDIRFFLSIPKEVAETTNDLKVRKLNYEVIKEDPILAFDADIKELVYTIDKHTDTSKLEEIILTPIKESTEIIGGSSLITGYSIFDASSYSLEYIGYIALGIVLLFLVAYFIYIKKKDYNEIKEKIKEANKHKNEKNHEKLEQTYKEIKERYKTLSKNEKKKYYPKIKRLHEK